MKSLLIILLLAIFETVIGNMTSTNNEEYNTYVVHNITEHTNNTWEPMFKKKLYWKEETWYHLILNYFLCILILTLLIIGMLLCAICISNRNLTVFRINQCFSSFWVFVVDLRLRLFHNENLIPAPAPPAPPASPVPGTSHELPELSLPSCSTHFFFIK
ncbi:uncharacterized protein LOC126852509 [Cataglyphis hispanica]|uniref:uncharacterized protein LOC126852509 n=1 Tax=Cataglyphis hispanica TaxID=1086592 RepID=UPI00217FEC0D|nr:uncharacterized protein LOC126852509 [Cataglyphis hispanica]